VGVLVVELAEEKRLAMRSKSQTIREPDFEPFKVTMWPLT
jgi:hypothetical protein